MQSRVGKRPALLANLWGEAMVQARYTTMMSISPGMSAGQAGGYFSQEDYYLKGADHGEYSRWFGKGAAALELSGKVKEEEFRAVCAGIHPASGTRIVAPKLVRDRNTGELVEIHRAGNDCTYSAPKSVSVLYAAGDMGVKEAHDAAVIAVLRHKEERYTFYRSHGGIVRGEMVAAVFDHATSRNLDPQLHSHVFVVNAVRTSDGGWRGNWNRTIFQDQKSLGLLYRQELARELEARGYRIAFTDRSQMFFGFKGHALMLTVLHQSKGDWHLRSQSPQIASRARSSLPEMRKAVSAETAFFISMAEAHGNRTHQGGFSPPSPVLKTGPPTSDDCASRFFEVLMINASSRSCQFQISQQPLRLEFHPPPAISGGRYA